jgi:hypothetical protein
MEKRVFYICWVKNARALPTPVDNPARNVMVKANMTFSFMLALPDVVIKYEYLHK